MKKIIYLLLLSIISINNLEAQKKVKIAIGPQISIPTYSGIPSFGIGGSISSEYFFNKKISGAIDISYDHFEGHVIDYFKKDTINGFTIMPVIASIKYYPVNIVYVSGGAGAIIGIHNAGNGFALSPGAGVLIPLNKSKIDLGLKFIAVTSASSFPENNFLNKGGYSFLTIRVAYLF